MTTSYKCFRLSWSQVQGPQQLFAFAYKLQSYQRMACMLWWEEPTAWWRALGPAGRGAALWDKSNMPHMSSLIQHFKSMWTRQGGPIQTVSLRSRALSALKHSLFTVGLCLGLCHVTLWPSERRLLRLVSKKGNSELLWVPAQRGLVWVGFIIFLTYWHVWSVVALNLCAVFLYDLSSLLMC